MSKTIHGKLKINTAFTQFLDSLYVVGLCTQL